jgi:hypothetical protein
MRSLLGRLALFSGVAAMMIAANASDARADMPRLSVDWERVLAKGESWAAEQSEKTRESHHEAAPEVGGTAALGSAWFGVAPKVSLVARDWGGAQRLAGGPVALTDVLRVSRSYRMVMTRIRLGEGRIVPFTQLGLGQWRVDTDFMPHLPRNVEVAAQFGGGIEMHLVKGWDLAAETDLTVLYREIHEPQQLETPRMWGTFLASRVEW